MKNNKVSILLPIRNEQNFLTYCLQSILDQSYKDWELIAIDDHSSDDSWNIVERFSSIDKRIKCYKNRETGVIHALRTAYALSEGAFVTRMDADDIMLPRKIEFLHKALTHHGPRHIALGLVKYFSHEVLGNGYKQYEKWLNKLTLLAKNWTEIYKECVIPSPCWMLYRSDLDFVGAFESNIYPEDYDLCFRLYKHGITTLASTHVLHLWRDHSQRSSRTQKQYADNRYLELKVEYFLQIEYKPSHKLVIWGAGRKGKSIAKLLLNKNLKFDWVCDNNNKIGHQIYGVKVGHYGRITTASNLRVIVAVAGQEAQVEIRDYVAQNGLSDNVFFFC